MTGGGPMDVMHVLTFDGEGELVGSRLGAAPGARAHAWAGQIGEPAIASNLFAVGRASGSSARRSGGGNRWLRASA
jgi:hypothetical protein